MKFNLNKTDNTSLHISAYFERLEAKKYLVERGPAINYTNRFGETPLNLATRRGQLGIILYLTKIAIDIPILDV